MLLIFNFNILQLWLMSSNLYFLNIVYRKRKFKKMIVDPDVKFSSQMTSSCSHGSSSEKRRTGRNSTSMPRYNISNYKYSIYLIKVFIINLETANL